MNLERFLAERAGSWQELESLVARAGVGSRQLSPAEILRLGTLYRAAAADLALARRLYPMAAGTERLQGLVVRAHAAVYGRATRDQTAGEFFSRGLWRQIWGQRSNLAISAGVMVGAVVLGVVWAVTDPASASGILPGGANVSVHTRGAFYGISVPARGGLAVQIFVNNIIVSMTAIGGGFTFGILTLYSLAYNGALLGVLGALEWRGGGFDQFVRLIVPHGLLELSCIALAGAGGMAIARALIDPGRRSRADALSSMVPALGALVLGVMVFLVVAGLTEGFITPWDLPAPAAVGLGVVLAGGFWTMVVVRGRPGPAAVPGRGEVAPAVALRGARTA